MRRTLATCVLGVVILAGCNKRTPEGLPPATEWQAGPAAASAELPRPAPPPGMRGAASNPHAGLDMSAASNPHAGLDMGGDPHAGLDMQGAQAGGTDVTKLGLAAPDPNRRIDPSHRVTGTITVGAKVKDRVKAGTSVFVIAKRAGADGAPSGPPLAVDKLAWSAAGAAFELTDAQAMVAGTELTGDVVVVARYDQDSDALSKQPGDVTGQVRVKIPADGVKLVLDTVLP
jgi:hypothetical protein